jgi:uncharacterized protein (DUF433 family)
MGMFSHQTPERSRGRFTLGEAAILAGLEEKAARHVVNNVLGRPAGSLGARDVVFFVLRKGTLPFADAVDFQKALYERLHEPLLRLAASTEVRLEVPKAPIVQIVINTMPAVKETLERIRAFREGARNVERREDVKSGALVFKGTRIPVAHIGALIRRGVPLSELREDFPQLTEGDYKFARMMVELNPPQGRPRKRLKFRRQ